MAADAYVVKSHNFTQLNETISELLGMKDLPDMGAQAAEPC
jgi:hypothetical protein